MGKTSKPLTILVHPDLAATQEILDLSAQGHQIKVLQEEYDLILDPRAWRMNALLLKYLNIAVKVARARKYAKGKPSEG